MLNISINLFNQFLSLILSWISWILQLSKWLYSLNFQYFECDISNNINYYIYKKKSLLEMDGITIPYHQKIKIQITWKNIFLTLA